MYELVHSEDREELQRHLMWNSNLPTDRTNIKLQDMLHMGRFGIFLFYLPSIDLVLFFSENCHLLERNFTVRFRCLLDNTSGFLVCFPNNFGNEN